MILKYSLFLLVSLVTIAHSQGSNNLISVLNNQSNEIASFIDNVLRQQPSSSFFNLIDSIKQESPEELDDTQLYEKICIKMKPLRSRLDVIKIINLIRFQKNLLGKHIQLLLGDISSLQNCLEIGTPGTYLSTIKNHIKGEIYVLLEQSKVTDVFQAHSWDPFKKFKGYNEYIDLNNYEPISSTIPDNTFDLIVCTIGLHHVPPAKLDDFIVSIKRVLRPGGIFLLREHNAYSKELVSLAYAAHSIFNAMIPQEPTEVEINEVRNFNSLIYWRNVLQDHGFIISPLECLQEGDSTLNTFIKCTKKSVTFEEQIAAASMFAEKNMDYARDGVQTYLTIPEWNNVDAAQHYGAYITKTPFYEFPYIAHIKTFWKTFFDSWCCAAREKGGHIKLLLSPHITVNYTLMNVFIGFFMTIEYSAKALLSWPIRSMLSGVEASTLLALVYDPLNELDSVDASIITKELYEGSIKLVSIPRYMQFLVSVKKLAHSSINFIKIANNENIMCKIRYKKDSPFRSIGTQKFTWQMPTLPEYIYAAYLVPVRELKEFIRLVEQQGAELLYLHDF